MRSASTLLYVMGWSFLGIDGLYLTWSLQSHNFEIVGLITMGLSAILCLLMAFYFSSSIRALGVVILAEDRQDAEIDDGDPELGHFSPWSWWPILLAGTAAIIFIGMAIGPWLAIIGVPLLAVSTVGWVFEYYRGYFAR